MSLADDEVMLAEIANDLVRGLDAALAPWLRRQVADRVSASPGSVGIDPAELDATVHAVSSDTLAVVRELLDADIDRQWANPLALVRSHLGPITALLASAGVAPVARDPFAERSFPDDVFDLAPAGFRDIDESLHEPGLRWGAAKAHVHLARRRAEGQI